MNIWIIFIHPGKSCWSPEGREAEVLVLGNTESLEGPAGWAAQHYCSLIQWINGIFWFIHSIYVQSQVKIFSRHTQNSWNWQLFIKGVFFFHLRGIFFRVYLIPGSLLRTGDTKMPRDSPCPAVVCVWWGEIVSGNDTMASNSQVVRMEKRLSPLL